MCAMSLLLLLSCQREEQRLEIIQAEASHTFEQTKMTVGDVFDNACPVLWNTGDKVTMINAAGARELLSAATVSASGNGMTSAPLTFPVSGGTLDGVAQVRFWCGNASAYGKATVPSEQVQHGLGMDNTNLLPYTYAFSHSLTPKQSLSFSMRHPMAYVKINFFTEAYKGYTLKSVSLENLDGGAVAASCSNVNGSVGLESAITGLVSGTESDVVTVSYSESFKVPTENSDAWLVALPTAIGGETPAAQNYAVYFELEENGRTVFARADFKTILYPSAVNVLDVGEITLADVAPEPGWHSVNAGELDEYMSTRLDAYVPVVYEVYDYPSEIDLSEKYSVTVEGLDATVINANKGGLSLVPADASIMGENGDEPHFSAFGADVPVTVKIKFLDGAPDHVDVRPLSKNYRYDLSSDEMTITLNTYDRISVEADGDMDSPLFIFVNPVEQEALHQAKNSHYTKVYEAGQVYDVGEISFLQKDHIYIQGGAVVKGYVYDLRGTTDISVRGCGILDGRSYARKDGVRIGSSDNLNIENIIILNRMYWSLRLDLCNNALVDNVKVIAVCPENDRWDENDAFHLIGCTNTILRRCFGYSWDDAFNIGTTFNTTSRESYGCTISDAIAWNVHPGNSFEIGWLVNEDNHDHSLENCYAIHSGSKEAKNYRAGVSIHNEGTGSIYNISYDNIYIEDPTEHGIYLGLFNNDEGIGQLHDITLTNVNILKIPPCGITFRGLNAEHMVRNITFNGLYIEGTKLTWDNVAEYGSEIFPMQYYENINFN